MGTANLWICLNCAEEVEEHFNVCWNCQADRNGRLSTAKSPDDDPEETRARVFLTEKHRPKQCPQCKVMLRYAGKKDFHEGDFGEIVINRTRLDMHFCPSCLRVEFFLADPGDL